MVTAQLRFVDAGDLYITWRWEHGITAPRVVVVPRALVQPTLDEWARAVPSPLPGESGAEALARSLARGPLVDRDRECALAGALSRALLPHRLAQELNAVVAGGVRPHLRVQSSPSTALVPWEALRVDEGERTVHHADVSVLPPATVANAPERRVSPFTGPAVGVLDPRVPGFADASALGSVLDAATVPGLAARHGVRRDWDRDRLERALADAGSLLYVGHVTVGTHALDTRLHLSCGPDTQGRAALLGGHRPLTASDIALGHRPGHPWRTPNRVALIACESADARFAEPTGLVTALVHTGAEYVVATRWTLPTDAGLTHLVPGFPGSPVLGPTVEAVDAAQSAADPVAALCAWQRSRADRWESTGDPTCTPLVWAALSTAWAPRR